LEAAEVLGVKAFDHPNGELMEGPGGIAVADNCIREGKRQSIFRAYTYPVMDRPNLTVLTDALVLKVIMDGTRATGVEVAQHGRLRRFNADAEVVLAMGAMNTPKILMLSGIGDEVILRPLGIPVVQHLPGVGKNFQNHTALSCIWETPDYGASDMVGTATMFWPSRSGLDTPDLFAAHAAATLATPENLARFEVPDSTWTMFGAATHPSSRGTVELASTDPNRPVRVSENGLSHPNDVTWAVECIRGMREVGNSSAMRPYLQREVMPGDLKGDKLQRYLRDAATTFFHHVGTSKMGRDRLAVVDGSLRVYGIDGLRVADGSVMPRITVGNTMAPCVIIGERAAEELSAAHGLVGTCGALPIP
jgi:choline dehydrogenase